MPTENLNNSFIKHYEAEVHNAYQRMGSKLRNTVRTRNNVKGSSAVFQKVGEVSVIDDKIYGRSISPDGPTRGSVDVPLKNYYTGDWIDALDELKTSNDEKMILAQAGAYALGRKTDEIIIKAMSSDTEHTTIEASTLNKSSVLQAFETLGANDVPDDGQRFAIVGWKQWSNLLQINEFANADYIGDDNLPWKGTQAKQWLGTLWMPHSGTALNAGKRQCFWYHRTAIGHAIGKDIATDISWHGDYASYFVSNMMSQGAKAIDPKGIVQFNVNE